MVLFVVQRYVIFKSTSIYFSITTNEIYVNWAHLQEFSVWSVLDDNIHDKVQEGICNSPENFDSIQPKSKVHIIYPYQNEIAYIDINCNVAMFCCMIKMILSDARKIKNDIQP